MFFGYNINGFAFHRLNEAVSILADLGYRAIGLTLDHHHLDPFDPDLKAQTLALRRRLEQTGLRVVIETGCRFLLDPWLKHQPTLISREPVGRARRIDFLCRAIRIAADLDADAVSFWSGAADDDAKPEISDARLMSSLEVVLGAAEQYSMPLAFEPEPGMAVATLDQGINVVDRFAHPLLGLTVDVGHLHCNREGDLPTLIKRAGKRIYNVHIEDMRANKHDHLMLGEGEIAFEPVLAALAEIDYRNGVYVELSRHSHDAVRVARAALAFLTEAAATAKGTAP